MNRFSFRPQVEPLDGRVLPSGTAITVGDVSVAEGSANALIPVYLSVPSTKTIKVDYKTVEGTAVAGSDYEAVSGTLTFPPGQTRGTIGVPMRDDTRLEPNETFFVKLSKARNATIADGTGIVTILDDDDGRPRISISGASGYAGYDMGSFVGTTLAFWVTLSAPADEPVTVNFSTADNTAVAGVDYVATAGTITFAPGQTSTVITVEVIGNGSGEVASGVEKSFFVNLSGASSNAVITDDQGLGMISFFFNPPPTSEDPGGYVNL